MKFGYNMLSYFSQQTPFSTVDPMSDSYLITPAKDLRSLIFREPNYFADIKTGKLSTTSATAVTITITSSSPPTARALSRTERNGPLPNGTPVALLSSLFHVFFSLSYCCIFCLRPFLKVYAFCDIYSLSLQNVI